MCNNIPYRTKFRRTKLPKIWLAAENFVRRKFLSAENFVSELFKIRQICSILIRNPTPYPTEVAGRATTADCTEGSPPQQTSTSTDTETSCGPEPESFQTVEQWNAESCQLQIICCMRLEKLLQIAFSGLVCDWRLLYTALMNILNKFSQFGSPWSVVIGVNLYHWHYHWSFGP